jgi:kinesin family member 15
LQIAEERKVYSEEKDEEVKLLERSIEELESTVCALENKVSHGSSSFVLIIYYVYSNHNNNCYKAFSMLILTVSPKAEIINKDTEWQKMQREKLEVELQKIRHQMLAVPCSVKSWSSMEDGVVDLGGSSRSAWL